MSAEPERITPELLTELRDRHADLLLRARDLRDDAQALRDRAAAMVADRFLLMRMDAFDRDAVRDAAEILREKLDLAALWSERHLQVQQGKDLREIDEETWLRRQTEGLDEASADDEP